MPTRSEAFYCNFLSVVFPVFVVERLIQTFFRENGIFHDDIITLPILSKK